VKGPAAGLGPFYMSAPDGVAYGARAKPPWATTLGLLPLLAAAFGAWPHRSVLPIVGISPNAVPHGGRSSCWGTTPDVRFSKILIRQIFFGNYVKINIKKFLVFDAWALPAH
jgi:hypothetical protein